MIDFFEFQNARDAIEEKRAALCVARMTAGDAHIVKSFKNTREGDFGVITTTGIYAKVNFIEEFVLCNSVQEAQAQLFKK